MSRKIRKIVAIILLFIAIICLGTAGFLVYQYEKGKKEFEQIENTYTSQEISTEAETEFTIDWDALLSENPDVVGWIRMDPEISYPIVQGSTNQYYLRRGFHGGYSINGCIFMHAENQSDWSDYNTVVYGHNMNSGAMFGNNRKYQDKAYAERHPYFYIHTPKGYFTYRIFDTIITNDATFPYTVDINSPEEFSYYLEQMIKMKHYGLPVSVSSNDRIVSLSTCTSQGKKRFIIQGVMETFTTNDGIVISKDSWSSPESPTTISDYKIEEIS